MGTVAVDPVKAGRKELAILVADSDEAIRALLSDALNRRGFTDVTFAADGLEALEAIRRYRYDMVLLDLRMPRVSGEEVFDTILTMYGDDVVVLVTTAYATVEQAVDLMKRGVHDYIVKPFRIHEVGRALERAEQRCRHLRELADSMELIFTLVRLMENKDPYLRNHSARVRDYAVRIARAMDVSSRDTRFLEYAALLHDVGKAAIDLRILHKPGPLTSDEWALVKRHPTISRDVISPVKHLSRILPSVYLHHERYDGSGYPEGLAGDDIPLFARVLGLADAYDAMTSDRPFRCAMAPEQALRSLEDESGVLWDPNVVEGLRAVMPRVDLMVPA